MQDTELVRLECVWCDPPHAIDEKGDITEVERMQGLVSQGMCPAASKRVMSQIDEETIAEADARQAEYERQQEALMDRLADAEQPVDDDPYLKDVSVWMADAATYGLVFGLAVAAVIVGTALYQWWFA